MIRPVTQLLRRFRRDEDGSGILIEFMIFVPLLFGAFLMAVELGVYSMRQMYLDRGLDIAVRFIRLNTSAVYTHDDIKRIICDNSGWLENCEGTLRLEMVPLNPRNFAQLNQQPDCIDQSEPIEPVRGFTPGQQNQLMIMRACIRFDPVFPTSGLGREMAENGGASGQSTLIATSAFVQEPG